MCKFVFPLNFVFVVGRVQYFWNSSTKNRLWEQRQNRWKKNGERPKTICLMRKWKTCYIFLFSFLVSWWTQLFFHAMPRYSCPRQFSCSTTTYCTAVYTDWKELFSYQKCLSLSTFLFVMCLYRALDVNVLPIHLFSLFFFRERFSFVQNSRNGSTLFFYFFNWIKDEEGR